MAAIRGIDCKGICNECGKNLKGLGGVECYATRGSTFLCVGCLEDLLPKVKDVVKESEYTYKVGDTVFLNLFDGDLLVDTCSILVNRVTKTLAFFVFTCEDYSSYTKAIPINFNKDAFISVKNLSGVYKRGHIQNYRSASS